MAPPRLHRVRIALAVSFLLTAVAAIAEEDEFSEPWLERRELEMTESLTAAIENVGSESVNRNVDSQLSDTDSARAALPAAPPAAIAPSPDSGSDAETATRSTLSCESNPDHSISCIVHHSDGLRTD